MNYEGIQQSKVCPKCQAEKPREHYHIYFDKARQKYRISNYCKPCAQIVSLERYKKMFPQERELYAERSRKQRLKNKGNPKYIAFQRKYKRKVRKELKDTYIKGFLCKKGIAVDILQDNPELIEAKRLQIKIKRKLKELKNGDKKQVGGLE